MLEFTRDVNAFFTNRWTTGVLLLIGLIGLLATLTHPELFPPTLAFAGSWYTLAYWLLLSFSVSLLLLQGLRAKLRQIQSRGLGWALNRTLTSIPLAIALIVSLVLLGLISTVVPQLAFTREIDLIARYGPENYSLLHALGFFTIFNTWYAYGLVALFVVNLGACTLKRLRASLRYVRMPMKPKRPEALTKTPCARELALMGFDPGLADRVRATLRNRGFRVREADQGRQILAEKHRWERFAIDVFHVALLMAIGGLLVTNLFGYDELLLLHQGEVFTPPGRDFRVRVDEFWSENYPGTERVMDWKTRLTVIEDGREVKTGITEVNHPFSYGGVSIYQAAMGEDWLGGTRATFRVAKADGTELGEYEARVDEGFTIPEAGIRVEFGAFLPDFALENGVAYSKTMKLLNPAAFLTVYDAQTGERLFRTWTFSQLPELQSVVDTPYQFYLEGFAAPQFSGLELSWDPGLPVAYASFAVMIVMLVANLLFSHQMVWVHVDEEAGWLIVGGRSRKGDFSPAFDRLVDAIADSLEQREALRQDGLVTAGKGGH